MQDDFYRAGFEDATARRTYVVQAKNSTNELHRLLASSIGVAIPSDKN